MKSITILLVLGALAIPFSGFAASGEELVITVDLPAGWDYELTDTPRGQKLGFDGCGYKTAPGGPMLPTKTFLIALPPGTRAGSAEVRLIGAQGLSGIRVLDPSMLASSPWPIALDGTGRFKESAGNIRMAGTHQVQAGWISGGGKLREYGYAAVTVCPCTPGQDSEVLLIHDAAEIRLALEPEADFAPDAGRMASPGRDRIGKERARATFVNFDGIEHLYEFEDLLPGELLSGAPLQAYDYVIITTSSLLGAVTSSNFIAWKTSLGYSVRTVLTTDPEIAGQAGGDLAEQIRNFLRAYYVAWGIEYVLMVGNSETVPMRYCYPDPSNHTNTAGTPGGSGGEVPTDYYYADLSSADASSWDSDGDGYHGEYGQDSPDFMPEVYVGRIPTDNLNRIPYALNKIVTFEQDTGAWKENALHAAAFWYFTHEIDDSTPCMDAAHYLSYIEADLMPGWTVTRYSEQAGLEASAYAWPGITETAFATSWRTGQYAVVNWGAHGWTDGIARKVWDTDDGDGIPEASEISWPGMLSTSSDLDDDHPSIVTSASCLIGCPEPNAYGNMGVRMLVIPGWGTASAVIASARSPYGTAYWPPGGSESIIYEFNDLMITGLEKVGQAFYNSKFYCNTNYGWTNYAEYINMYTFNLWGDPSMMREGIDMASVEPGAGDARIAGPMDMSVWPSPARGAVNINYYLPSPVSPSLEIFDVLGRRVRSLEVPKAAEGHYSVAWDGSRDNGTQAAAGIYWIRMTLEDESVKDRIVLIR